MTAHFAERVALRSQVPEAALDEWRPRVQTAAADVLAVAVAARHTSAVRAVEPRRVVLASRATHWLTGRPGLLDDVVEANAVAAHALDFDDMSESIRGHYSGVVMPLLVALAEERGDATGLAAAYAFGARVARALAIGLDLAAHYRRGFHSTATVGGIASAAAAARFLALDTETTMTAVNVAASGAAGVRATFGTDGKPLQVGRAAREAFRAVDVSRRGARVLSDVVAAPSGLFATLGRAPRLEASLEALDEELSVAAQGANTKMFPCCYELQRLAHATRMIAARLPPGEIRRVQVSVHRGAREPLIDGWPDTATRARFSAEFTVATVLARGDLALVDYSPEAVADEALRRVGALVVVAETDDAEPYARIEVDVVTDARVETVTETVSRPPGHAAEPTPPDLTGKIDGCLDYGDWAGVAASDIRAAAQGLSVGSLEPHGRLMEAIRAAVHR